MDIDEDDDFYAPRSLKFHQAPLLRPLLRSGPKRGTMRETMISRRGAKRKMKAAR